MDLENITLSQSEKDKLSYHLHMESKRIIHIILYTKQIDP